VLKVDGYDSDTWRRFSLGLKGLSLAFAGKTAAKCLLFVAVCYPYE